MDSINEKYDIQSYEDSHKIMIVLMATQFTKETQDEILSFYNMIDRNMIGVAQNGAVILGDEVITLKNPKNPEKNKICIKYQKRTQEFAKELPELIIKKVLDESDGE